MDSNRNIYVADINNHRIQKWAPGATSGITVAGGNGPGEADSQLYFPRGVFVDDSGNIFIADYDNNRVQKWGPGTTSGSTVAGDHYGQSGSTADRLNHPISVYVDANGNLFITDQYNNRIQEWAPGATSGITVAGGNGQGAAANQLYYPNNCWPDRNGNLYVADGGNGRVQRFADTVLPYYVPGTGGNYTAFVSAANGGGSATTAADTILNYEFAGVSISALYHNTICLNYDTLQLTATPSYGGASPTYDWYENGYYLYTTTDSSITIPGIANHDSFLCVVTSDFVCLYPPDISESNHLIITVDSFSTTQTASITASPGNMIQYGQNVTFTCVTTNGGAGYQWSKNSHPIAGATDSVYSSNSLVNGDEITCTSESSYPCVWNKYVVSNVIHMQVPLGVGQLTNVLQDIHPYPNPNNGIFNISGTIDPSYNGSDVLIELFDLPGKILLEEHSVIQNGAFVKQINLDPSFANGVYLLHISAGNTSQTLRLAISR